MQLTICELSGPTQRFPPLDNAVGLLTLYVEGFVLFFVSNLVVRFQFRYSVLRNNNISGEMPAGNLQLL
ncbi:hypothetical protein Hanom_Chr10g00955711 [Helianthus anomalus]